MINAQKTVTSTPSLVSVGAVSLSNRRVLILRNIGVENVYYGYSQDTATSSSGQLLAAFETRIWEHDTVTGIPAAVYMACASGKTSTVAVEEG